MRHICFLILIFSVCVSCTGKNELDVPEEPKIIDLPIDLFDPEPGEVDIPDPVEFIFNAQSATLTNPSSKMFWITGGSVVGTGGASSSPAAIACTQYVVDYTGNIMRNANFNISSSAGKNILTYQLPCTLSKAFVLFSSPDLARNESYMVSSGGSVTGGKSFHGLYNGATYSGGYNRATFTVSSMITNIN